MNCEHEFKHIETIYNTQVRGYGDTKYERIDRFYCKKCLEPREIVKQEYTRDIPSWYKREVQK